MHNVDMWNSELGTIVLVSKEKKGKKVRKHFSPKPASMKRLSEIAFRLHMNDKVYFSPFICEGCVGWSVNSKVVKVEQRCNGCGMPLALDEGFEAGGRADEPVLCEACHYEDRPLVVRLPD